MNLYYDLSLRGKFTQFSPIMGVRCLLPIWLLDDASSAARLLPGTKIWIPN